MGYRRNARVVPDERAAAVGSATNEKRGKGHTGATGCHDVVLAKLASPASAAVQ